MTASARQTTLGARVALAFGLVTAGSAQAQEALLGPGAAYVSAGVSGITTRALDDRLAAHGYPTLGSATPAAGVGAYRVLANGLMLGAELQGLARGEEARAGRVSGLGGGYATLGVGYVVAVTRRARVYPRLGLGAGGLSLWVERGADTVAFDALLENPQGVSTRMPLLSRDGLVVDLGAGAELLPSGRGGGPLIGVRVGYLAANFGSTSNWQLHERTASGGPAASIAGPYLRVVVGGAWRR